MKLTILKKNGAVVTMEKTGASGMYVVLLRAPSGQVHDKVRCDDYSDALAYRRSFLAIARGL